MIVIVVVFFFFSSVAGEEKRGKGRAIGVGAEDREIFQGKGKC